MKWRTLRVPIILAREKQARTNTPASHSANTLRLIWTEPALQDFDGIAEHTALDNPRAADRLVRKVFDSVERLRRFPASGRKPPELTRTPYREVIVAPCWVFYRVEWDTVYILHVMRAEQLLRKYLLEQRDKDR